MGQNEHSGCSNWGGYKRLKSLQAFPCVHFDDILQYQTFGPNSNERGTFPPKSIGYVPFWDEYLPVLHLGAAISI